MDQGQYSSPPPIISVSSLLYKQSNEAGNNNLIVVLIHYCILKETIFVILPYHKVKTVKIFNMIIVYIW